MQKKSEGGVKLLFFFNSGERGNCKSDWVCFSLLNVSFFFRTYNCFNSLCLSGMISEKVYYFSFVFVGVGILLFPAPSNVLTEGF